MKRSKWILFLLAVLVVNSLPFMVAFAAGTETPAAFDFESIVQQYSIPMVIMICVVIGLMVKALAKVYPRIPTNLIPVLLPLIGLLLTVWFFSFIFSFEVFAKGIASGWAATGAYESVRQQLEKAQQSAAAQ